MRKIYVLLFLTFVTTSLLAGSVSRETAMRTASEFFLRHGRQLKSQPVMAARHGGGAAQGAGAAYYVFDAGDNQGYVIVSGDDSTVPVLGYVDSGSYDEATLPDNMKALLQGYAAQIEAIAAGRAEPRRAGIVTGDSLGWLMQTTWGQGAPYNGKCPTYNLGTQRCATGCVATAMAQVMYFHRSPNAVLAAIPGYRPFGDFTRPWVEGVAAGSAIDYDNMLADYSGSYTDAQADAVADLMLYAGVSVQMGYDEESSAAMEAIPGALMTYFGYQDVTCINRADYKLATWENIVYDEVAARQPVILGAESAAGGGHAFIVDGYGGNDYFHINWGWSGAGDGYFLLTVANPYVGAGLGFTIDQQAVVTRPSLVREKDGTQAKPDFAAAFDFTGTKVAAMTQPFTVTFTNRGGEFYKTVYAFAGTAEEKGLVGGMGLSLPEGGVVTHDFAFYPEQAGTWTVWLCTDIEGDSVVASAQVEIGEAIETGVFYLSKCDAAGTVGTETRADGFYSTLDTDTLTLTMSVSNTSEEDISTATEIRFYLDRLDEASGSYASLGYMYVSFSYIPGYYTINFNPATFSTGLSAGTYRLRLVVNGEDMDTRFHFVIPASAGITQPRFDKAATDAWYTIDGQRLTGKPARKGLYIHGGRKVVR